MMDDDDDVFADLVAAMNAEVEDGVEDSAYHSGTPSLSLSPSISTSTSSQPAKISSDEAQSVTNMMQRIKQLEEELARQKGVNAETHCRFPPVSAKMSPSPEPSIPKKPMLTDLDYNVFTSKPKLPVGEIRKSDGRLTLSDIGLSESSDEDEDFPSGLSLAGRALKRKLAVREEEENVAKKSRTQASTRSPFATFSVSMSSSELAAASRPTATTQSKNKVVEKCGLSGIRILNPIMSAEVTKNTIGEKRMFKLSQLSILKSQISKQTEWVTIGVIVQKLPTKQAANGAAFSIWKLSDLEDTVHLTSLFLFADAHKDDWKIPVRTVIVIINPSIMPKKEGKDELAISLHAPGRLLELGYSEDMGICKGQTKSGQSCGNLVNTAKAEYCVYHLQGAFQKIVSQRMELQSNFSGVEPKTSKVKEAANGYFYGGKMFSTPASKGSSGAATSKNGSSTAVKMAPISKAAQALIDEARGVVKAQMSQQEQKTLDSLTAKNAQLNQLVVIDGPGARNLVRSVTKKEADTKPMKFITPTQLLKDHKTAMTKLMSDQNKRASDAGLLAQSSRSSGHATPLHSQEKKIGKSFVSSVGPKLLDNLGVVVRPKLGRGLIGEEISLDDGPLPTTVIGTPNRVSSLPISGPSQSRSTLTPSQSRALAKLQESGKSIQKSDPNKMSSGLSARARDRIQGMAAAKIADSLETKKPVCNLQDDPEIQALLSEMSRHDDLCQLNDIDYMDGYFQRSAARESLEEALENTTEMECSVVTCKQCKYTASSLSERCFKERHDHVKHKATKKFYQCRKCSKRKPSFSAIMPSPCKSCGMQNFQRCGMLAYEQKGPKLDSEILHIRGEECSRFLNGPD